MQGLAVVIDVVAVVIIIISAYLAMVRGFIRELFALAGWIAAFFAALYLSSSVQPFIAGFSDAARFLEDCQISLAVAFIMVFGVALILAGILGWAISGGSSSNGPGVLDQGLGFIYGALRGMLLIAVLVMIYQLLGAESPDLEFFEETQTVQIMSPIAAYLQENLAVVPGFIEERLVEMKDHCEAGFVDIGA